MEMVEAEAVVEAVEVVVEEAVEVVVEEAVEMPRIQSSDYEINQW